MLNVSVIFGSGNEWMTEDSHPLACIAAASPAWPLCTPITCHIYSGFCFLSEFRFLMGAGGGDVKCM